MSAKIFLGGIISDTHGLLRPEVVTLFKKTDMIIHAGDHDNVATVTALEDIDCPLVSVRGNMDYGDWAGSMPWTRALEIGEINLYLIHNLDQLDLDPRTADFQIVVFGHTHEAVIYQHDGVIYFNPGSAGPHGRARPVTAGLLQVKGRQIKAAIVNLEKDFNKSIQKFNWQVFRDCNKIT